MTDPQADDAMSTTTLSAEEASRIITTSMISTCEHHRTTKPAEMCALFDMLPHVQGAWAAYAAVHDTLSTMMAQDERASGNVVSMDDEIATVQMLEHECASQQRVAEEQVQRLHALRRLYKERYAALRERLAALHFV